MSEINWKAPAVADLMAIVDYVSDDNPNAAIALIEDIQVKVARISAHPKRGRPGRVDGSRELVVPAQLHRGLCRNAGGGHGAARASCRADVSLIARPSSGSSRAQPAAAGRR